MKILNKLFNQKYLLITSVLIVLIFQSVMTLNSLGQIRFEELSESVRNVYYLQQHQIFDGISSNVGWYGTVLALYNIFGFNIFIVKFYKMFLLLLSLISLSIIFKKHLKIQHSWILILFYGLSPTLLYFNTIQTSFGVDLLYFPIVMYLLFSWKNSKTLLKRILYLIFVWLLAMVASMSYGTFLAYLPLIGIFFLYNLFKGKSPLKNKLVEIFTSSISFLAPLGLSLIYLNNPRQLIFDPDKGSGIFRGGGMGEKVTSLEILINHIKLGSEALYTDLFLYPNTYYYEVLRGELSHKVMPYLITLLLLISFLFIYHYKRSRFVIITGYLLMITGLLVGGISDWLPGIRRMTPVMMGFFIIVVGIMRELPETNKKMVIGTFILSIGTIIIFHLKIYPQNLNALQTDSVNKADECFHIQGLNPAESLSSYVILARQGVPIDTNGECRLHELYPAISGSCLWNNSDCKEVTFVIDKDFKKPY